ncbi:MAG TPA: hypothetical protein VFM57_10090 [Thermoleophilaceae bacterium]|nr:hypothetical protein [Thermoleophilaceae bacterium]
MTTKSEFNAEEWARVAQAPALAALMVMVADRGGVIRESIALGKAYAEARSEGGSELIQALVESPPRIDPADLGPADQLRAQLPQRVEEAVRTVEATATPEEAQAYRDFILRVADVVAHAAKEGGVLGIGGKEVTAEEQVVLDELSGKLAASSG